jgi:hypothetical protein
LCLPALMATATYQREGSIDLLHDSPRFVG